MSQRIAFIVVLVSDTLGDDGYGSNIYAANGSSISSRCLKTSGRRVHFAHHYASSSQNRFSKLALESDDFIRISDGNLPILLFTSIRLTGIAIGTVVTIGSAPMFSGSSNG